MNSIEDSKPTKVIHQLQKITVSDTPQFLQTELENSNLIEDDKDNLKEDDNDNLHTL